MDYTWSSSCASVAPSPEFDVVHSERNKRRPTSTPPTPNSTADGTVPRVPNNGREFNKEEVRGMLPGPGTKS